MPAQRSQRRSPPGKLPGSMGREQRAQVLPVSLCLLSILARRPWRTIGEEGGEEPVETGDSEGWGLRPMLGVGCGR